MCLELAARVILTLVTQTAFLTSRAATTIAGACFGNCTHVWNYATFPGFANPSVFDDNGGCAEIHGSAMPPPTVHGCQTVLIWTGSCVATPTGCAVCGRRSGFVPPGFPGGPATCLTASVQHYGCCSTAPCVVARRAAGAPRTKAARGCDATGCGVRSQRRQTDDMGSDRPPTNCSADQLIGQDLACRHRPQSSKRSTRLLARRRPERTEPALLVCDYTKSCPKLP